MSKIKMPLSKYQREVFDFVKQQEKKSNSYISIDEVVNHTGKGYVNVNRLLNECAERGWLEKNDSTKPIGFKVL